jgi:hypothetical protein
MHPLDILAAIERIVRPALILMELGRCSNMIAGQTRVMPRDGFHNHYGSGR